MNFFFHTSTGVVTITKPVSSAEQNDSQSQEISVTDDSQAENMPMPVQEAEITFCLLCLAASQKITHAAHSLMVRGDACKGRLCVNPSSRIARLAGAPSLHVNRP